MSDAGTSDGRLTEIMRESARNHRPPGEIPMIGQDRIRLKNWALLDLIASAYSVRATDVFGPAWLADQVFDVEATVPDGTVKGELNAMLQALLEERFGLKVHRDAQVAPGFALVVGKGGSKLKPAAPPVTQTPELTDEERRTQIQEKLQRDLAATIANRKQEGSASGDSPGEFHSESWHSITLDELAAQLTRLVHTPVVDATNLSGKYSVAIRTSSGAEGQEVTVADAVEKLGLKLEPRKVTRDVVVVDQVSRVPMAN